MSPPYLPTWYLPAIPSKFVYAKLQTFKWNSVLYAREAHVSTRVVCIFHARWVILKRSGLRSSFTRKWLVTGMTSPMLYANQIKIIANKTPPGLLLVGGTCCFEQAMDWCLLVEGEYKLYHSVWEPPIMCVAWKISPSLGCYVDNESIPLKILFTSISKPSSGTSTNPCFPLRRAYLFTFMLSHHPLIKKRKLESTNAICMYYC